MQQDDRDDVGVAAHEVGEDRRPGDAPARPHVGDDREDAEEDAPGLPEAREAGHRGLAGGQRVALDLHVEEVLDRDPEDRRPQEAEADVGGDVGPEDVLARAHAQAREDDARPEDLAERQRLRHVRVAHRRQMVARWLGGVFLRPVSGRPAIRRHCFRHAHPSPGSGAGRTGPVSTHGCPRGRSANARIPVQRTDRADCRARRCARNSGMRAIWGCSARASTAGATRPAPSVSAIGPSPTSSPAAR